MKIYYNEDGFVCAVYPYYKRTENSKFIEVTENDYEKVKYNTKNHAWKVVDGKLVNVDIRTEQEKKAGQIAELRKMRDENCFTLINRGKVWYDTLTEPQVRELKNWYQAWLNVTETLTPPETPAWLK